MSKVSGRTTARSRKPVRKRTAALGYARGRETRQRIVETAINVFGEAGFEQASTRLIADQAHVNLGALTYYFGSKEGLYRACAEHIAEQVEAYAKPTWDRLERALENRALSKDDLLGLLRGLFETATADAVDRKSPRSWLLFIIREMSEPGLATKILYDRLTSRSIHTLAALIGRITDRPANDPDTIIRAVSMIGYFTTFRSMRRLMLRALGWPDFADGRNEVVKSALWQQVQTALAVK